MKKILSRSPRLFLFFIFWLIIVQGFTQTPEVNIRFTNPTFDCDHKTYCLDVEYSSDSPGDTLYGTNVRFFYNSTELTFIDLRSFITDYDIALTPITETGVSSSGASLFGMGTGEAATWVNGAVELINTSRGKEISNGIWTYYYEACFSVIGSPDNLDDFCPTVIWDLEADIDNGGFFPGNDGVVITLKDGLGSTASEENVEHLNWAYSGSGTAPYGVFSTTPNGCLTELCATCAVPNTSPSIKSP